MNLKKLVLREKDSSVKLAGLSWLFLLVAFLLSLAISAYFLRQNNLRMLELRDAVVELDQSSGEISEIEPALLELRSYVLTHMNATLKSPLELPGSYNLAIEDARAIAEASGSVEAQVYSKAQSVCERPEVLLSVRAQCIQDYVLSNAPEGEDIQEIQFPPKEQFSYNFVSPSWSFDLAGISTVISAVLFLATAANLLLDKVYPRITRLIESEPI